MQEVWAPPELPRPLRLQPLRQPFWGKRKKREGRRSGVNRLLDKELGGPTVEGSHWTTTRSSRSGDNSGAKKMLMTARVLCTCQLVAKTRAVRTVGEGALGISQASVYRVTHKRERRHGAT
ncbi:hypothetical protein FGB62_144g12 [Gracilaria domingensis]|nr:hypothetical protein FGB62_144g12 [Gracilaria domingensis]